MVRTRHFHCRGLVESVAGKLRSRKPCGVAKKKKRVRELCPNTTVGHKEKRPCTRTGELPKHHVTMSQSPFLF